MEICKGVKIHEQWTKRIKTDNKEWFNRKCYEENEKRDEAWEKWRKQKRLQEWKEYMRARNYLFKVLREEKKNSLKKIVNKCKFTTNPNCFMVILTKN